MKTFQDLVFKPHKSGEGQHARMTFPNGYGVSVVFGDRFYSDGVDTYEVAATYKGAISYEPDIMEDDVLGYQTPSEVTSIMAEIQKL